jgi:hypothetical protein
MNARADRQLSARLADMRSHAVADVAIRGAGAELPDVACALLGGPNGLRQNCRTTDGEVTRRDMGLQTGENSSSARLYAGAQGLDIRGAVPLGGEQPQVLRACAPRTAKQHRRAERDHK